MTPEVPFYSATLFDPREQPVVRWRLLGRQSASHGAVRRGGAGRIGGRATGSSPSWHRTRCSPTPSSRPPAASTCRWPPGRHAPRARAAARAARLSGRSAQRGRRGGLLGALPGGAAGGCAAADLDAPSAAVEPGRSGHPNTHGGSHRFSASAVGRACAPAGGTGAPRVAGRGRHCGAALAGRPPDP